MKKYIVFSITLLLFGLPALAQTEKTRCIIVGEVLDRPYSKELLLTKDGGDLRVSSVVIPINEGKFYYELEVDHEEAYALVFADEFRAGAWRPVVFFAESDTLYMSLHPQDKHALNVLKGGVLNQEMVSFNQQLDELFELEKLYGRGEQLRNEGRYLSMKAAGLREQYASTENEQEKDSLRNMMEALEKDNEHLTPEALSLKSELASRHQKWIEWKTEQVVDRPSLVTYRELVVLLDMANAPYADPLPISVPELLVGFEEKYKPKYPDHPYTQRMDTYIASLNSIKKGGKYIDFTAPDFEGNAVTLSEQIKGKVALINLWASWCGPCRRKAIEMIPIYETYRTRGFEVVGIARERSKEAGINAAKMDEYPWLNLIELNDSQDVWSKYGLGNSGGGVFLVDEEGVILAVSPTAEEVRSILHQRLD